MLESLKAGHGGGTPSAQLGVWPATDDGRRYTSLIPSSADAADADATAYRQRAAEIEGAHPEAQVSQHGVPLGARTPQQELRLLMIYGH